MSKASAKIGGFLERLRHVVAVQSCRHRTDHDLLEEYVARHDEVAFAGLVDRYGPMVMGLCRRQLRHRQDAEDAFQAVFLVLARKAGAIRKSASLPSWLHSVALRAANRLRAGQARRRARETALIDVAEAKRGADVTVRETQQVLEEELDRLADKYRAPLLLCCVQGKTRDEAAQQLGWRLGVLRGRLDRGRELLRGRLARRGVALPAVLLPLGIAGTSEAAVVPALLSATVRAAMGAAHTQAASAALSGPAAILAQGVIQAMFLAKIKMCAAGLVLLACLGTGASVFTYRLEAQEAGGAGGTRRAAAAQAAKATLDPAELQREIERLRLELEHTRLLLKVAKEQILDMRAEARNLKAALHERAVAAAATTTLAQPTKEAARLAALEEDARRAADVALVRAAQDALTRADAGRLKRADVEALKALMDQKTKAAFEEAVAKDVARQAVLNERAKASAEERAAREAVARAEVEIAKAQLAALAAQKALEHEQARAENRAKEKALEHENARAENRLKPEERFNVFSPDGKLLVIGRDTSFVIADATTGKELRRFLGHATAVAFAPDGKTLASGSKDKSVTLWDLATGRVLSKTALANPVDSVAFTADGRSLIVRHEGGLSEIDAQSGKRKAGN